MTRNIKALFADEDAVSPVIGVILMVAITVILAAVIGTFVLGLGQNVQDTTPQVSVSFESESSTTLTMTLDNGGPLEEGDLTLLEDGSPIADGSDGLASGTTWETGTTRDATVASGEHDYSIRHGPSESIIAEATVDVMA